MLFIGPLVKYAAFNGRATRAEFWTYSLLQFVVAVILWTLAFAAGIFGWVLLVIWGLATFIPTLAVSWRRLHDTGRSGAWWLLSFVPFGGIVLIIFYLIGSDGDNQYGPAPG
jgi:uncharacterized membrane protein YhaH (DUF805 family)